MKVRALTIIMLFVLTFSSCKKEAANYQIIPIPNGDFEQWDNMPNLAIWHTNSCPACVPPYETYIVKKITEAENGQFAAKFVYNNVYSSYANNKFAISLHPTSLIGYIKSNIASGDTAIIHIDLFSGNNIVDNGVFYETSSNANYRKINIPISQSATNVDSALIKIVGGKKQNTELSVDNLVFLKND
ncbi:MAG: hypothetical protein E6H09_02765 [Bacteroidetes bacterium]|jgi:hypothetical protein|nr:MAG: hypothetical protein E6H09_02765 [Bacteroidota bacterium]